MFCQLILWLSSRVRQDYSWIAIALYMAVLLILLYFHTNLFFLCALHTQCDIINQKDATGHICFWQLTVICFPTLRNTWESVNNRSQWAAVDRVCQLSLHYYLEIIRAVAVKAAEVCSYLIYLCADWTSVVEPELMGSVPA